MRSLSFLYTGSNVSAVLYLAATLVKRRVASIEILRVQLLLCPTEGVEETVRVKYFDIYISNAESIKL